MAKFSRREFIDLVRQQLPKFDPFYTIIIRGKGGTRKYPTEWWSSVPIAIEEMSDFDDSELGEYLYGITDEGPEEFEIMIAPESEL